MLIQYEKHQKAIQLFKEINKNPENYLIIHYSCESFYDIKDGHTPRITSIAVYSFKTAQTESFSIHKTAEKKHIPVEKIEEKYDELEKNMLDQFFQFVKEHSVMKWLHWNMRDINYGFKAIEHRYEALGRVPFIIKDTDKIDISRLFIQCYGIGYIQHPRLESLIDYNHISCKNFLSGKEEAEAFSDKEFIKLHQSTLKKVDVLANLLNRAISGTLKVKSKWKEIYGLSPQGIYEYLRSLWWVQVLWTILSIIFGAWIGRMINN